MNILLIPAYEPTDALCRLIRELKSYGLSNIVIIDDGSGPVYKNIFDEVRNLGCQVITHEKNMGKGMAIKTGISYAKQTYPHLRYIITCDADGQHLAKDVSHINDVTLISTDELILGVRDYHKKGIPFKSRIGNLFSSFYFHLSTGVVCPDTQTGLRAIPVALCQQALGIQENHFDYEMVFLTLVSKQKIPLRFVPIETLYIDHNEHTHFKPVKDSFLIYRKPLKFLLVSLMSAVLDLGIFALLVWILEGRLIQVIAIASISARVMSGSFNFIMNRVFSFQSKGILSHEMGKYFILYIAQLLTSILLVYVFSTLFINLTWIKLMVDSLLFIISYMIQKKYVFTHKV